jgi:protein SCO1/2
MRLIASWILALAAAVITPTALAHSVDELETMLGDKEKFFQPLDEPAPEFTLRNADGAAVDLADLRGKVVVLHFIYASCPDVCPLHAERIAEVQAMVNQTPMKEQVQFITITTDPANDTPEVLRDYGPAHGLDPVNWAFLTTTPDQPEDSTRRLAEAYGHRFDKTEEGYQVHGVVTHVIDKDGQWRANFHGLKFEPINLVMFVNALVNDVQRPHGHGQQSWWDWARDLF